MTTKQKALKALLILAAVLLLCLFFARTLQTITTAKIQKISATRGKLEDKIPVKGEILFSEGEPVTLPDAQALPITITRVMAKPGYLIKQGDTLFTAHAAGFEEALDKIKQDYDKKARELAVEVAAHIRIARTSEHNDYYNEMLATSDAYYDKLYAAQAAALAAGYTLPDDPQTWGQTQAAQALGIQPLFTSPQPEETPAKKAKATPSPSPAPETPTPAPAAPTPAPSAAADSGTTPSPEAKRQEALMAALKTAMQEAYTAKTAADQAAVTLHNIYKGTGPVKRTGDGVYKYIQKIDGMKEDIAKLSQKMLELEEKNIGLQKAVASREGWLMEMNLKVGDKYDAAKPAYTLSKPGEQPVLRCDITDIKKPLAAGMKATIEGYNKELTITDITFTADSKKYAVIALDQETLSALGGLSKLMAQPQEMQIIYKAQRTTTLIPASALRSSGEGKYYVYTVQQNWGSMLGGAAHTVKKQDVTVIETSSKLAALEDDLSYVEIADREDRTLADGQAVMEYVD